MPGTIPPHPGASYRNTGNPNRTVTSSRNVGNPNTVKGVTRVKAFMAIAEEELAVGKADARFGQWVEITMKKDYLNRSVCHEGPSNTRDTKIAALRLKSNAFKALEGEKSKTKRFTIQSSTSKALISNTYFPDSDSIVEEDTRSNNEFLVDLNAEDKGVTRVKAFMAIAEDEPAVGKADARSLSTNNIIIPGTVISSNLNINSSDESLELSSADNHHVQNEPEDFKPEVNLDTLAPQDRWFRDKHILMFNILGEPQANVTKRSRVRDFEAASADECLYVNFLSKIELKKVIEALEEEGSVIAMQEELN
ncbi:hypothetical protein Tco_0525624 [Tanacetum coccineum]